MSVGYRNRIRGNWVSPLGGDRSAIKKALLAAVEKCGDSADRELLCDVVDYWWNSSLDRPSMERAEERLVARIADPPEARAGGVS